MAIQEPQQNRSIETMNRILAATSALLEEKTFTELKVTEIVRKAKCSVGAFYGRFKDKEALLHALDENYFAEFEEKAKTFLAQEVDSLEACARLGFEIIYDFHSQQPGLIRTLVLKTRRTNDPVFKGREKGLDALFPELMKMMMDFEHEIKHPHPNKAVSFGFLQGFITLREMVLWPRPMQPYEKEELIEEVTKGFMKYVSS